MMKKSRVKDVTLAAKNADLKSTSPVTFAELWENLSKNYMRNGRDFVSAYGGNEFYHKIDALYRYGAIDKTARQNESHTEAPPFVTTDMAEPSHALRGASSTSERPRLTGNPVKSLILTNDLLTSEARFIVLTKAYKHGRFYAILTLKRAIDIDDRNAPGGSLATHNWHTSSLFQSIVSQKDSLLPHNMTKLNKISTFDDTINAWLGKFHRTNSRRVYDQDNEELDNEFFDIEENEENALLFEEDKPADDNDNRHYNNAKSMAKRFTGFGPAISPAAYRLEIYQQFFNHFFYMTKHLSHEIHLLPDFF